MPSARHILIVNSRSVHQPVFVVGAPHSGADLIGRALKTSATFHVTMGQPSVLRVVYAFARRPSMYQGRTQAAATVIRDAFAQGWQVTSHSCLECSRECRAAAGLATDAIGPCVEVRGLERFGDASPDLIYCAEALTYAFPGARIIQVIRNGQDVVTRMLADPVVMSWFRPSFVNVDTEFPNPFFGVETEEDRDRWPTLSLAGKSALRWRGAVRLAARLRRELPAEQLITVRYETLLERPADTAAAISAFAGVSLPAAAIVDSRLPVSMRAGTWRRALSPEQAADVENVAGEELRRVGYALSGVSGAR